MSKVIDIDRTRKRPRFRSGDVRAGFTFRIGEPTPELVAVARVRDGNVELTFRESAKLKLSPSDAETIGRGLLTLAASARAERKAGR